MTPRKVTLDEIHTQFEEQGYVLLPGLLQPDVIQGVQHEMEQLVDQTAENLMAAGKITDPHRTAPFETRLARVYETCLELAPTIYRRELHLAGMYPLFFHPQLLDIVESLLGSEIRLYPNYSVRPKLPDHEATQVLWHQDGGYTQGQVEALRMVNVWTPLVPARVENGCMQFIPGTHRLGIVPHERRQHYLEIQRQSLDPLLAQATDIEMDPGDIVLFHNLLFHQGLPNRSTMVRWSVDWRYQDATQPTLRAQNGHIARSRSHPERAVQSAEQWTTLKFE